MSVIRYDKFRGMIPRLDEHLLPVDAAQAAVNTRLSRGRIEPFRSPLPHLATGAGIQSIYKYGAKWLCWTHRVNVVPSLINGESERRIFWSGDGPPKQTNAALLNMGAADYVVDPANVYRLGVPAPVQAPAVSVTGSGPGDGDTRTYVYAWMHGATIGGMSTDFSVEVGRGQSVQISGLDDTPPATWKGAPAKPTSFRKALFLVDKEAGQYQLCLKMPYNADTVVDDGTQRSKRYKAGAFKAGKIAAPAGPVTIIADDCSGTTGWTLGTGWVHGASEFTHAIGSPGTLSRTVGGLTPGTLYVIYVTTGDVTGGSVDILVDSAVVRANVADDAMQAIQFTATAATHEIGFAATSDFDGQIRDLRVDDASIVTAIAITGGISGAPGTRSYVYCWSYQLGSATYRTDASFPGTAANVAEGTVVLISGMASGPATAFPNGAKNVKKHLFRLDRAKKPIYRLVATLARGTTEYTDKKRTKKLGWKLTRFPVGLSGSPVAPTVGVKDPLDIGESVDAVTRQYVYTYVTAWGEESAPSPVSDPVELQIWEGVALTTDTSPPAGYPNIVGKRFYRTDVSGNWLQLFAEDVAIATATIDDSIDDLDLGTALVSADWDVPPDDLAGLVQIPGIGLVGFSGNTICPSEFQVPYAFPVKFRQQTEHKIVALGVTATGTVVVTEGFPYMLTGTDPANLTPQRLESYQACVSAASLVDMGESVIYASPDGLVGIAGGQVAILTADIITREQWQAYAPESMHAYQTEGRYLAFFDTGSNQGAVLFDPADGSLVTIDLPQTVSTGFCDPVTDTLYLQAGTNLSVWDGADPLTYRWRSGRVLLDTALCPAAARVDAESYSPWLRFRLYADGVLKHEQGVASNRAFRLPAGYRAFAFEVEVEGVDPVRRITMASSMAELGAG